MSHLVVFTVCKHILMWKLSNYRYKKTKFISMFVISDFQDKENIGKNVAAQCNPFHFSDWLLCAPLEVADSSLVELVPIWFNLNRNRQPCQLIVHIVRIRPSAKSEILQIVSVSTKRCLLEPSDNKITFLTNGTQTYDKQISFKSKSGYLY